jgi:hypothetical protein
MPCFAHLTCSRAHLGLISVLRGETTLPVWSYIVALISGTIVAPFSTLLVGRLGSGVATATLFKMMGGAINPGRPVANLYVSGWVSSPHSSLFVQHSCSVHDVEPRCHSDFGHARCRPQIGSISQSTSSLKKLRTRDTQFAALRFLPVPCF